MHSEQNNLNFTLSGRFCLGAEFQKLCQEQLQESTTGESCVPQQTLLTPRHISHRAWTKSWFCKKNTPALHHFFLLPVTKVRRVQKMQVMNLSSLPAWSHIILKPQTSEERDIFTCFDVIYWAQSIGSSLQRRCRKRETKKYCEKVIFK